MNRGSKVGKSQREKDYYAKAIKSLDSDSTVDTSHPFPRTDKPDRVTEILNYPRGRRDSLGETLIEHFRENWLRWAASSIALVLLFFIFDFNRDVGNLEGRVGTFENVLKDNNTALRELDRKVDDKFETVRALIEKINLEIQKLELNRQRRK